ncbi:MAG: RelA/SpoT family protein [Alistipes sp.]|jgi:GTP pyrophosphokinase|nr:RelA/SpoT family protein [Alistipes sp.]
MEYTEEDERLIAERFAELVAVCESKAICHSDDDRAIIVRAFNVAKEAHKGVRRRSGEPYITHPIAVARICVEEIGLGVKSVVASLLHDVVEDTDLTVEDISQMFTPKIASMVDGLTKISGVFNAETSEQAESFRKMLLTLLDDVRVILIKIADRLHNMRTLGAMPREKQVKITSETIYLFAPLAYRLGLYAIKSELEDLSLKYRFPEQYNEIEAKLEATKRRRAELIDKFDEPIIARLRENGVDFEISGRVKSVYSVWRKMQSKQVPFEEIYDLFAVRIIFRPSPVISEKTQCWYIYELVTDIYPSRPDRLRDWITYPKANGYEALHTTVMSPDGLWVEVQIRSERMNQVAEQGVAAHWKHNYLTEDEELLPDEKFDNWLGRIRDALSSPTENAVDFLDNFQRSLYTGEIVVFTPKGESRQLLKGATVLDFAFEIHSKLGVTAIGAKINHKIESIYTELKSGDQIEVLTSKSAAPVVEWLDHVVTTKAKQHIKNYLRRNRQQSTERGKELFEARMAELGIVPGARVFRKLLPAYHSSTKDEFYGKVGAGTVLLDGLQDVLRQNSASKYLKFWTLFQGNRSDRDDGMVVGGREWNEEEGRRFEIAECCIPIPGDDVTGYREPASGKIVVHKTSCSELTRLASQHGENIETGIRWSSHKAMSYLSIISLQGIDRVGILLDLVGVITGELNINIRELRIQSHDGIFEGEVSLYVTSTDDLNAVIGKIKKIKGVDKAQRINS